MNFAQLYSLWQSAQAKAATISGLTVTVNDVEGTVECKANGQVFYSSTDLNEIHIALDSAIALNGILNP